MKKYDIPILCSYLLLIAICETTFLVRHNRIKKIYNQVEVLLQNQDLKVVNIYETDITVYISRDVTPYSNLNPYSDDSKLPKITRWRTDCTIDQDILESMRMEGDTLHITGYNKVVKMRLRLDPSIEVKYDNESNFDHFK